MGTSNFNYKNILGVVSNELELEWAEEEIINGLEHYYKNHKRITTYTPYKRYVEDGHNVIAIALNLWDYDEVNILVTTHYGYYEGANIDYEVEATAQHYSEEHLLNHPSVIKAISKVEELIRANTSHLKVVARFSNGETIYEEVVN